MWSLRRSELLARPARGRHSALLAFLAAGATLVAVAPAQAATFCVAKPGCVGTAAATPSAAATAANNAPGPDRIELGEGEFSNVWLANTESAAVQIVGAGRGKTVVTGGGATAVVTLAAAGSSVSDLTVHTGEQSSVGIDLGGAGASAERVEVVGPSQANAASDSGIIVRRGATIRDAIVTMPLHPQYADYGISLAPNSYADPAATDTVIEDVKLAAGYGINVRPSTRSVAIRRGVITAGIYGVHVATPVPHVTVEELSASAFWDGVQFSTANAFGVYGTDSATAPTVVDLRHVSLSAAHSKGRAISVLQQGLGAITVNAVDSAFLGGRDAPGTGSFDIELGGFKTGQQFHAVRSAWRSTHVWVPGVAVGGGLSQLHDDGGNVDLAAHAGPLVADLNAGDLRPVAGSVLVDNGTPGALEPGVSGLDAVGAARLVDGDGDGEARRDIGAYEAAPGTNAGHVTAVLQGAPKGGATPPTRPLPVTRITSAFGKLAGRRAIIGTATGTVGVVRVSITRKLGKRCQALSAKAKWVKTAKLKGGTCAASYQLKAKGTTSWKVTLPKALPKGTYAISSRGEGTAGTEANVGVLTLRRA